MRKKRFWHYLFVLSFTFVGLISCSSGDDAVDTTTKPSGVIPDNTDSGKNNNSEPDNIKPNDNNSGDNSGNMGGSTGDNSGNTGGSTGDNSGNMGGSTGDNSGNTGGSTGDNSGNTGGSTGDNSGNTGGSTGDNSGNTGGSTGDNSGNTEGSTGDNSGNTGGSAGDNSGNTDKDSYWKLVFEDNFEGPDSIPNTEYWSLAPKGDKTWNRNMSESYGQAYQKGGYLYLFGMRANGEYLTGGIESKGKFDFTHGQVKCRARFLRQPQGNHTGIWMMPEPPAEKWPMSGEIDIMEHLNKETKVYETVHNWWADELGHKDDPVPQATASIDNEDFNVYGIIWDENEISFLINGKVNFTYHRKDLEGNNAFYQWPYTKPFYLILSQSLGGEGTWEGEIDDSELPAIFQIDWIKVWQHE